MIQRKSNYPLRITVVLWVTLFGLVALSSVATAQVTGPADGLANRAVGRLAAISANGPGYLYYGVNGADRGLGYIGSYMTLGGFIPFAEDDLGGAWNADLRSHLSVNGGFFSNVGAVRKQLLGGGSLLGVGIYWDYDGDLNQYPVWGDPAAVFGQYGHAYQQVGVSGELLTDWGNLRSNGYMPVGTTGYQLLPTTAPFFQNYIIAQNGIDAALGGADLELGVYVPGLTDWAGMINVGGYALGNSAYTTNYGPQTGQDLVPWFGGVYTRLDLTFARNWDLSLQYNNDSFFESTGFVRLTYRMGGSRRRNVPDQMEQPMFRNEHIIRSHQTPLIALNPQNGNQPWQVVHVNNTALPNGNGTAEAPFRSLAEAQASSLVTSNPWTIAYVQQGSASSLSNAYRGSFAFQQPNQFLVGSGGPLTIATQPVAGSSLLTIPALTSANPILNNIDPSVGGGASVVISGDRGGATIANLQILGSLDAIRASGNLASGNPQPVGTTANPYGSLLAAVGASAVRNVSIAGDGTSAGQRGVYITGASGAIEFSDTSIINMTSQSFQVGDPGDPTASPPTSPISGGNANIDFNGTMSNNIAENGNFPSLLLYLGQTTGGTINIAATSTPPGSTVPNKLLDVGGEGVLIENNDQAATINIANLTLVNTKDSAIFVNHDRSTTTVVARPDTASDPAYAYGITKNTNGAAIAIAGGSPKFDFFGTINNVPPAGSTQKNIIAIGPGTAANPPIENVTNATITIDGPGINPLSDAGDGVRIDSVFNSTVQITGLDLRGNGATGIRVENSTNTNFSFIDTTVDGTMSGQGVLLSNLGGSSSVTFESLAINLNNTGGTGVQYENSTATGTVLFSDTTITGATTYGVLLNGLLAGTTHFDGLNISLASSTAQALRAVDAATVTADVTGSMLNTISNASTTQPAIFVDQATDLNILNLTSVTSGVDNATGIAISLNNGGTLGEIAISDTFTVGGAAGTGANVQNTSGAAVTVNGTQISP